MSFLNEWLLLATVMCVAVASPGPDFIMAVRNSVMHGRKAGILTAFGFAAGAMVHLAYCILGLSAIIAQSASLFMALKIAGAAYLIWMGVKALRSKGFDASHIEASAQAPRKSKRSAFMDGFVTNVLNPKAILFFFALFTQVLRPELTPVQLALYAATIFAIVAAWFSFVALVLTHARVRARFLAFSGIVDKICGALFILLGLRLVLQKAP